MTSEGSRITIEADKRDGKPCIRGLRVTVGMVVGQIGAGHSVDDVLADYPYLEREDVMQALRYAAWWAYPQEQHYEFMVQSGRELTKQLSNDLRRLSHVLALIRP